MDKKTKSRSPRKALSPEARENQLIAAATNLAEQKILDGTASSQLIIHYLKLGTSRERLEKDMLIKKIELLESQNMQIQNAEAKDELYEQVISSMTLYKGTGDDDEDEDYR